MQDIEDTLLDKYLLDAISNLFTNLDNEALESLAMDNSTESGKRGHCIVEAYKSEYGETWSGAISVSYHGFVLSAHGDNEKENALIHLGESLASYRSHNYQEGFLHFRQAMFFCYWPQIEFDLLKNRDLDKTLTDIALQR